MHREFSHLIEAGRDRGAESVPADQGGLGVTALRQVGRAHSGESVKDRVPPTSGMCAFQE